MNKLTTVRIYKKDRNTLNKIVKKMGKLGSQQDGLKEVFKIAVECKCNKN